jgi:predicted helicase
VFHYDLYGKREAKYAFLLENTLSTVRWRQLKPSAPQYFFVQKNFFGKDEYDKGFSIQELFPVNSVGVVSGRDDLAIQFSTEKMREVLKDFSSLKTEEARRKYNLGKDSRDWSVSRAQQDLIKSGVDDNLITPISYRPFDTRWTYYTGNSRGFQCMARSRVMVMGNFMSGENIGLITIRRSRSLQPWNTVFLSNAIVSGATAISSLDINYVFPLYLYPVKDSIDNEEERRPNLNTAIVQGVAEKTGLLFTVEKEADSGTFAPIDLLDYIYAVLYSNVYRKKYAEFLKIDFPRVPYPAGAEQFRGLAVLGGALRRAHLLEDSKPAEGLADFPISGANEVETLSYKDEKVYINKKQYFENVPPDVYEYYIGGYQPAQKWLKDRRGVSLSFDDIQHYRRIVTALKTTIELQARIDDEYK